MLRLCNQGCRLGCEGRIDRVGQLVQQARTRPFDAESDAVAAWRGNSLLQEADHQVIELLRVLPLGPMPALTEDVELRVG